VTQLELLYRKVVVSYPPTGGSARPIRVRADDGLDYMLNDDSGGAPVRAREWICRSLADNAGLPVRAESLNAAIIILGAHGLDVRLTPNPERLHAIAPKLVPETLDELKKSLESLYVSGLALPEQLAQLRRIPGVIISEPGTLHAENAAELSGHLDSLVARLLTPVRAPATSGMPKTTALVQELSTTFRKEKLLGRGDEDLSKHKVVRNVAVSSGGSLRADFVAKNRFVHVTETVDLRSANEVTTARLKDIAVAAVTLDEAKRQFGRGTQRYFVYAGSASAEKQARGYLSAAEHHAEKVFSFSSRVDRAHYLDHIFAALRHDIAGVARVRAARARR
jgi:hypothetical protein